MGEPMSEKYDLIIVGGGPAGMAAGIYAARSKLKTVVLEQKRNTGGQCYITEEIENYPGFPEATGPSLSEAFHKHAEKFGVVFVNTGAEKLEKSSDDLHYIVHGTNGTDYEGLAVLIATGAGARTLGCKGEKEFSGKGVSYCATCDGAFFEECEIAVVGGGDSAVEEAMYLTKFGRTVTLLVRKDKLSVAKSIEEKAMKCEKLKIMWNVEVESFEGTGLLSAMNIVNNKTGEKTKIVPREGDMIFGVFIFVGYIPESTIFNGIIGTDRNYIVSDETMKTSVEGVFVAGDVRVKELRQVVTAVNDGAIAAINARKYVESLS